MASNGGGNNGDAVVEGGGAGRRECIVRHMKGSVESYKYFLARRTALEMLRDRGCVVSDFDLSRSLDDFRTHFGDEPDLERLRLCFPLLSKPPNPKKILVVFCGTEDINKATIRRILSQIINKEGLHRLILILQSKMNHFATKELEAFPVKAETFHITELLSNISKHIIQPKYEILNTEEREKLLIKYKCQDRQLPQMLGKDAIARYYGLEKGQVVRVTYAEGVLESHSTYRCVV